VRAEEKLFFRLVGFFELPGARTSGDWKFGRESRRTCRLRWSLNVSQCSAFCPDRRLDRKMAGLITDTKSALVALPDPPGMKPGSAASTLDYLRKVTDWKGISSYTHTFLSLNKLEKIPLCLHGLTVRKRTKRLILRPHLERLSPLDRREVTPSNLLLAWECLLQI
jgi:hypothetical protein